MDESNLKDNLIKLSDEVNIEEKTEVELNELSTKRVHHRRKKFLVYSGAVIVGLVASFFISYSIFEVPSESLKDVDVKSETTEVTPTPSPKFELPEGNKYIAYIKDNEIYTIVPGFDPVLLEENAGLEFSNITWKSENEISFSKCSLEKKVCEIFIRDIDSETDVTVLKLNTSEISDMIWSREGDKLFYHYRPDGSDDYLTEMYSDNKQKVLYTWENTIGTGLSLTDEIHIDLNNDSSKILVTNTLASLDDDYIIILNQEGKVIDKVTKSASFARFTDVSNYFYYSASRIFLNIEEDAIFEEFKGLNPEHNNNVLVYWKYLKADPTVVYIRNLDGSDEKLVIKNLAYPNWFDDDTIVGLNTTTSDGFYKYKIDGLTIVDIDGKNRLELDTGDVKEFAVQR